MSLSRRNTRILLFNELILVSLDIDLYNKHTQLFIKKKTNNFID